VFDGVAGLLSLAPRPRDENDQSDWDEAALGPPTVTLRNAHALQPPPEPDAEAGQKVEPAESAAESEQDFATAEAAYAARFSWQEKGAKRRFPAWVYTISVPILVLLLAGQALFHFRDAIAAHWPKTKPALITLCAAAGCKLRALQEITALSIEASDLQAD